MKKVGISTAIRAGAFVGNSKVAVSQDRISHYSVNHLILYSPSAYVFQGITPDYSKRGSSWTFQGKELPFIALDTNRELLANLWEDFKNKKSLSYLI